VPGGFCFATQWIERFAGCLLVRSWTDFGGNSINPLTERGCADAREITATPVDDNRSEAPACRGGSYEQCSLVTGAKKNGFLLYLVVGLRASQTTIQAPSHTEPPISRLQAGRVARGNGISATVSGSMRRPETLPSGGAVVSGPEETITSASNGAATGGLWRVLPASGSPSNRHAFFRPCETIHKDTREEVVKVESKG